MFPALPAKAIGSVKDLDESYRKPGRMKILLSFGNDDAILDSASRFVVMYRFGSIGAPAAAETKTKEGTFLKEASCARVMASKGSRQPLAVIFIEKQIETQQPT